MRSYMAAMAGLLIVLVCTGTFAADTAQPLLLEVVYDLPAEQIQKQYANDAGVDYVLSRKGGVLYERRDGAWVATVAPDGFRAINRLSGSVFCFAEKRWTVTSSQGVNVVDWGARGDYDLTTQRGTDNTDAIQAALDEAGQPHPVGISVARTVYVPAGKYLTTRPLNLTTDFEKNLHAGVTLRGEGKQATLFYASTGGIWLDATGSAEVNFEDFRVLTATVPNPSTVGILYARGEKSMVAIFSYMHRVWITLHSDPGANKGIGTVAVWNFGSEGHDYHNVYLEANLPYCMTRAKTPPGLPASIESSFVEANKAEWQCSLLGMNFTGQCTLVALDFHRPCLFIAGAGSVDMGNTYMSLRPGPNPAAPKGEYLYCVEIAGCIGYRHISGMQEGPGSPVDVLAGTLPEAKPGYGYLKNTLYLDQAEINVALAMNGAIHKDASGKELTVPAITQDAFADFFYTGIMNSRVTINYGPHMKKFEPVAVELVNSPNAKNAYIRNSEITCATASGDPVRLVSPALLRRTTNTRLYDYRSDRVKRLEQ